MSSSTCVPFTYVSTSLRLVWMTIIPLLVVAFTLAPLPVSAQSGPSSSLVMKPVPSDGIVKLPKNLARAHLGTAIMRINRDEPFEFRLSEQKENSNTDPIALITDDESITYPLPEGETIFILPMQKLYIVESFGFYNHNGEGTYQLFGTSGGIETKEMKWKALGPIENFSENGSVSADLASMEVRQVKLVFSMTKPGKISSLGIYGDLTSLDIVDRRGARVVPFGTAGVDPSKVSTVAPIEALPQELVLCNLADVYAGAKVQAVTSGNTKAANFAIDDNPRTGHSFASRDRRPGMLVNLGKSRSLRRVSVLHKNIPGEMKVYLLRGLPKQVKPSARLADYRPSLKKMLASTGLDPFLFAQITDEESNGGSIIFGNDFFSSNTPVTTTKMDGSSETAATNFNSMNAQFVLVSYDLEGSGDVQPLEVFEVNAFGDYEFDVPTEEPAAPTEGPAELSLAPSFTSFFAPPPIPDFSP